MATVARFPPGFSQFRWWYWLPVGIAIIPSTILYVRLCLTSNKSVRRDFIFEITFNLFLIYLYLLGQFIVKDQPEGGDLLISSNGTFFPKFYYYGTVYFYFHAQVWQVITNSFYRCITLTRPVSSKLRQKLRSLPSEVTFLFNVLVPFVLVFRQFFQDETKFIVDENGKVAVFSPPHVIQSNATQAIIVSSVGSIFCLICYTVILREMLRIKNYFKLAETRRSRKYTLMGTSYFFSLCIMTAYYFVIWFAAQHNNTELVLIMRNLYIIPAMLVTFVNPWMQMLTNRKARLRVFGKQVPVPAKSTSHPSVHEATSRF